MLSKYEQSACRSTTGLSVQGQFQQGHEGDHAWALPYNAWHCLFGSNIDSGIRVETCLEGVDLKEAVEGAWAAGW